MPGGIALFLCTLAVLAIIRILLGYIAFPLATLPALNLFLAVVFVGAPVLALYYGSNAFWTWKTATAFIVGGILVQVGLMVALTYIRVPPQIGGVMVAIAQAALPCWCVGLGALLATRIKEKNIILPIAIFLAAYDFFLVLTPSGFTQKLLKVAQPVFVKVAGQVPMASAAPNSGMARASEYIGMADFVFLAMFFVALFRFRMRTRATLFAVIPALVVYLLIVRLFGNQEILGFSLSALPAMVPIGLAVLIINREEFDLNKEEKLTTAVLAVLAVAFVAWAATRPKSSPQIEQAKRTSMRYSQVHARTRTG